MKRVLLFWIYITTSLLYCQTSDNDLIVNKKESRVISKERNANMMYVDNIKMLSDSSLIVNDIIVYVINDIHLCENCKLKLNNSIIYYKGSSNAVGKKVIKLAGKTKIEEISILKRYPNKSFIIMSKDNVVLKGTYNQKKNIKLDNDLYDIWVQGKGFLNNVLLTNFKL